MRKGHKHAKADMIKVIYFQSVKEKNLSNLGNFVILKTSFLFPDKSDAKILVTCIHAHTLNTYFFIAYSCHKNGTFLFRVLRTLVLCFNNLTLGDIVTINEGI